MHAFLRRAAWFILPLILISIILFFINYSIPKLSTFKNVTKKNSKEIVANVKKESASAAASTASATATPVAKEDSFFTVVIDPSHGGDDMGSIGVNSIVESHINLQFAFKLARALRMKGVKVFLTRMDDYNVPLDKRFKDAQNQRLSIYLSINCAYSNNKSLYGMDVFGFTPENTTGNLETIKNKFYEFYEGIYLVKNQDAMVVENKVSSTIKQELNIPYKSRLERKFIKSLALPANIPALSIFVGYISNYGDARSLSDEKQVDALTERLATAIENGLTRKAGAAL